MGVEMSFLRQAGFNDLRIGGLSLEITGPNPPTFKEFRSGMLQYAFAGTGVIVEQAFGNLHLNHEYKLGTIIEPHVHWSHNAAAPSGDVVWKLDYTLAKGFGLGTFPVPTTITLQQTAGAQYEHHIIEDPTGIPAGNLDADTVLLCRLYRDPADGNDTFEDDAFLLEFDFHFISDGMLTNEDSPPFTKKRF
jgi:hypothetical protein